MTSLLHGGFGIPTPDDRRPWLWVASIVSCSYSILTLLTRLLVKWELFGIEDAAMCVAYLLGIINWGLFNSAVHGGLGAANEPDDSVGHEPKLFYASQRTLLCTVYIAKISVLLFGRRIFSGTRRLNSRTFDGTIAVTALCGIASVALFSAGCSLHYAPDSASLRCAHLAARWTIIQVFDALTEVAIVALPTIYVSGNTVNLSSKITVVTLFGLRLLNIPLMAVMASKYRSIEHGTAAQLSSITSAGIWSQVLLGYALSSASFPCIRSFLTAFAADSKYRIHGSTVGSHNNGSKSHSGRKTNTQRSANTKVTSAIDAKSPGQHLPDEAGSVASDASQRMMIERSVEIEIAVEKANASDMAGQDQQLGLPYQGGHQSDLSRRQPRHTPKYQGGQ